MQKYELENLLGIDLSDSDYMIINACYNHPKCFFPDHESVADLYRHCGIDIFRKFYKRLYESEV